MQAQKLTIAKGLSEITPYEATQLTKYGHTPHEFVTTQNQPVEYLTGFVTFRGHEFIVNSSVLIPRVETEELVELVLQTALTLYRTNQTPLSLIDVGCGSGAIGLSLALALEENKVPFSLIMADVSRDALKVARQNQTKLLPKSQNIYFQVSHLMKKIPPQIFDLVMANLPYVPSARIAELQPSVRDFEPHLALDGGSDGLALIAELVRTLPPFLKQQSQLWLEIDETHKLPQFEVLSTQLKFRIVKDSLEKTRFIRAFPKFI